MHSFRILRRSAIIGSNTLDDVLNFGVSGTRTYPNTNASSSGVCLSLRTICLPLTLRFSSSIWSYESIRPEPWSHLSDVMSIDMIALDVSIWSGPGFARFCRLDCCLY